MSVDVRRSADLQTALGLEGGLDVDLQGSQPYEEPRVVPGLAVRAEPFGAHDEEHVIEAHDVAAIPAGVVAELPGERGTVANGHRVVAPPDPIGHLELPTFLRGGEGLLMLERVQAYPLLLHAQEERPTYQTADDDESKDCNRQCDTSLIPNHAHLLPSLASQRGLFRSAACVVSVSTTYWIIPLACTGSLVLPIT